MTLTGIIIANIATLHSPVIILKNINIGERFSKNIIKLNTKITVITIPMYFFSHCNQ